MAEPDGVLEVRRAMELKGWSIRLVEPDGDKWHVHFPMNGDHGKWDMKVTVIDRMPRTIYIR